MQEEQLRRANNLGRRRLFKRVSANDRRDSHNIAERRQVTVEIFMYSEVIIFTVP